MADNRHIYGLRWSRSYNQSANPKIERMRIASGLAFTLSGGSACDLNVGDPVTLLSTGYVTMCQGNETTPETPYGVIAGFGDIWDGTRMSPMTRFPNAGGVYGSNLSRQTKVFVIPIDSGYFEADADDKTTATDEAGYLAFSEENVSIILKAGSEPKADPLIDISTHATTNTLKFRLMGLSDTMENKDLAGLYVKLILKANIAQQAWSSATGV